MQNRLGSMYGLRGKTARLALLGLGAVALATGLALPRTGLRAAPADSAADTAQAKFDPETTMSDPGQARLDYIENCGGCHGVTGDTVPAHLPELEGRVGWFMCTPEARAYLLRLPNVAHSRIKDNGELADLMNYVVFILGKGTAPAGTLPFTAEEVARERLKALTNTNLTSERLRLAKQLIERCHAPASIRLLYPGSRAVLPNTASVQ
jgi:hypothetical protein